MKYGGFKKLAKRIIYLTKFIIECSFSKIKNK